QLDAVSILAAIRAHLGTDMMALFALGLMEAGLIAAIVITASSAWAGRGSLRHRPPLQCGAAAGARVLPARGRRYRVDRKDRVCRQPALNSSPSTDGRPRLMRQADRVSVHGCARPPQVGRFWAKSAVFAQNRAGSGQAPRS
ncbi:hypothetical protein B1A_15627, partial [mine drainage metagenome]